jgi:purine nucleosidase
MAKINLLLDTDIGTDADDAMTLVQLAGSDVELKGVTVGYGPTALRLAIAKHYLKRMRWDVPVHAGTDKTMSGKEIWLSGREGRTLMGLEEESQVQVDAVDFLAEVIRNSAEPISLLSIAPPTNIGQLFQAHPDVIPKIEHLVVMGGNFADETPEHNFASDAVAANYVLRSGIPTTLVGLDATKQLKLHRGHMEAIRQVGPVGEILVNEIYDWWDFWKEEWSVPHDPIALVALEDPGLFEFSKWGKVCVTEGGVAEGVSVFTPGGGNVRYVTGYEVSEVGNRIVKQIVTGATKHAND